MIFLILSILFSSITVSFFKVFELKKVDTFQAIIVNYFTCSIIGSFFADNLLWSKAVWNSEWIYFAILLGLLFIGIFYCIALTAQKISVSASMVAAKLSVVVPVLMAWMLYNETLNAPKMVGISISLIAVYFISNKKDGGSAKLAHLWFLPVLVFLGSGSIDTLLNYLEEHFIPPFSADDIVTSAFFFAFVAGMILLLVLNLKLNRKAILWGFFLGIPNYFSMYFLVKTLGAFPASYIFPINNIGIVALSTLIALLAFKEHLNKQNIFGLSLAIIAILLISFS
jgi:drug/metabolite transporter (DMT)-like permease